jgi:hypothetical protein
MSSGASVGRFSLHHECVTRNLLRRLSASETGLFIHLEAVPFEAWPRFR